jgi:hypothetical protein
MDIVLGTHIHPARGATLVRQWAAVESVSQLSGVHRVNLQFADREELVEHASFQTHAVLARDSRTISGVKRAARKPVVLDMFDELCREALRLGSDYFCVTNSDIHVGQELVDLAAHGGPDAYICSRMDFDGRTGEDLGLFLYGQDTYAVRAAWWVENSWRFQPYVIGEGVWDNAYTAIMLCHGSCKLINDRAFVRHEAHPVVWEGSPYTDWHEYLRSFDSDYLRLWYTYLKDLLEVRKRGDPPEAERHLQSSAFGPDCVRASAVRRSVRSVKARVRFAMARAGLTHNTKIRTEVRQW